jgi:hypothetical protein
MVGIKIAIPQCQRPIIPINRLRSKLRHLRQRKVRVPHYDVVNLDYHSINTSYRAGSPKKRRAVSMAVESQAPASVEKQVDNEGDALMASARSASEVPRLKTVTNATVAPLRKSASGATLPATLARLRIATPEGTSGELPSPRIQTEVDASYCSYDVTNTKYIGNQSPVSAAQLGQLFSSSTNLST